MIRQINDWSLDQCACVCCWIRFDIRVFVDTKRSLEKENFESDWGGIHNTVKGQLDPLIRANYKDRFGAAVGYLTADPVQFSVGARRS